MLLLRSNVGSKYMQLPQDRKEKIKEILSRSDVDALAQDWATVGKDIETVLYGTREGNSRKGG